MPRRVQVLRLDMPQVHVNTLVNAANRVQGQVFFDHVGSLEFDKDAHRIDRDVYDLEPLVDRRQFKTSEGRRVTSSRHEPVLIITKLAYGEVDAPPEEELAGLSTNDEGSAVISTGLWRAVTGATRLADVEPFVLATMANFILDWWADLDYHTDARACLFDYCDRNVDILAFFNEPTAFLCDRCYGDLEQALGTRDFVLADVIAARRLVAAARKRRACFVAMPLSKRYAPEFVKMFRVLQSEFGGAGWAVNRSDLLRRPSDIIARIIVELMASDLVIAEVSHDNPNVFYELGYADAARRDLLLLSKPRKLPFDLSHRHTIFWEDTPVGLRELRTALRAEARRR
jgi:hypothetical protein